MWLWRVRFAKTRSQATALCKSGKIRQGDQRLKAARTIFPGEEIEIRVSGRYLRIKVLALPRQRIGAKLMSSYFLDISPPHLTIQMSGVQSREVKSAFIKSAGSASGALLRAEKFKMEDYEEFLEGLAEEWEEGES